MLVVMKDDATEAQVQIVVREIENMGYQAVPIPGAQRTAVCIIGNKGAVEDTQLLALEGVKEAIRVTKPYKLISREYGRFPGGLTEHRIITVGDVKIGGDEPVFIAGPYAIDSRDQLFRIAEGEKAAGAHVLGVWGTARGGVSFSPEARFTLSRGLSEEELEWLRSAGDNFNMPVITEVRGESQVNLIANYVDILQIGATNMYNQDLLANVARTAKPVLLTRHFGAGIEEFLSFAEYIATEGNKDIILCDRGISPISKGKAYTRYALDITGVPAITRETYLPIILDPSHTTGRRDLIYNMSFAAIAAGASGLMLEVHYSPEEAIVDGLQTVKPDELKRIIETCNQIRNLTKAESNNN